MFDLMKSFKCCLFFMQIMQIIMNCSMELFHIRTLDDRKWFERNKKISTIVNHVTLLIPIILLGFNDTDTYFGLAYITKTVNLENNLKWTDGGNPSYTLQHIFWICLCQLILIYSNYILVSEFFRKLISVRFDTL